MTRLLTALPLLILSGAVFGQTFECRGSWAAIFDKNAPVLVVATINEDEKTGKIKVAGKSLEAKYYLDGINHRWDWDNYSFVIEPDGDAAYYAFNNEEATTPDQSFTCRQEATERLHAQNERQEEIERQRAENERLRAEAEAARRGEIDAESDRPDAMAASAEAAYIFAIQQKIRRNWVRPPTAVAGIECIVNIRQLPGGEVVSVSIGACNTDSTVRRSIEAAVYKASPLPAPSDPSVFDRNLRLEFRPEG